MSNEQDTQCYFVQLQIDSFLDGELADAPRSAFLAHMSSCDGCAAELRFAQQVHDAVMDLPQLDIADVALEPVYRLTRSGDIDYAAPRRDAVAGGWIGRLLAAGQSWQVALPAAAVIALVVGLGAGINLGQMDSPSPQLASEPAAQDSMPPTAYQTVSDEYSVAEVQQALNDLNTAIDYLNEVSKRTEVMIGDRFLISPLQESLNASFDRARDSREQRLKQFSQDPI